MYNYSIAYILTDDNKLKYYNIMMKSILSVRLYMPSIPIIILIDRDTELVLNQCENDISQYATIKVVDVPDKYSIVEKSRFLKTNLRKLLTGNILFIDSDTIICKAFPECISNKSFAGVWTENMRFDILRHTWDYKVNRELGLDPSDIIDYINSGVLWMADDDIAHKIFEEWFNAWDTLKKPNNPYDQQSLNYILRNHINNDYCEVLGPEWNLQICGHYNSSIGNLVDAYILHYFNIRNSSFLPCQEEYYYMSYKDPQMIAIIKDPVHSFGPGPLKKFNEQLPFDKIDQWYEDQRFPKSYQYRILFAFFRKCHGLFNFNERIIRYGVRMIRFLSAKLKM